MGALDDLAGARAFVAVADRLHVGRAADHLGVSRQTLATRLARYEDQAGVTLIDRSHRRLVSLTAAGEAALPTARELLRAASAHDRAFRAVADGTVGVIRCGIADGWAPLLDYLVLVLQSVGAGWRVDAREYSPVQMREGFAYGRIDCAFTRRRPMDPRRSPIDTRPRRVEGVDGVRIGDRHTGRYVSWRSGWTGPHAYALTGTAVAVARAVQHAEALRRREAHRCASAVELADFLRDRERLRDLEGPRAGAGQAAVSPDATGSRRAR